MKLSLVVKVFGRMHQSLQFFSNMFLDSGNLASCKEDCSHNYSKASIWFFVSPNTSMLIMTHELNFPFQKTLRARACSDIMWNKSWICSLITAHNAAVFQQNAERFSHNMDPSSILFICRINNTNINFNFTSFPDIFFLATHLNDSFMLYLNYFMAWHFNFGQI